MTAAVIAQTAGDGLDPRKSPITESGATKLAALDGTELVAVAKKGDHATYYATAGQIAGTEADSDIVTGATLSTVVLTAAGVSLSTGTAKDIASRALTVGTWRVSAAAYFTGAASTTLTRVAASLSDTVDTMDVTDPGQFANQYLAGATVTTVGQDVALTGMNEILVVGGGGATVHLVGQATFGVSTCKAYGSISAVQIA